MSDVLAERCAAGGGACEMEVSEVAMRITLDLIGMTGFGWVLLELAVVCGGLVLCPTRSVAQCGAEGLAMRAPHSWLRMQLGRAAPRKLCSRPYPHLPPLATPL